MCIVYMLVSARAARVFSNTPMHREDIFDR
jgi:hypothetical protein